MGKQYLKINEYHVKYVLLKNLLNLSDDNLEVTCSDNTKSRIDIIVNKRIIEKNPLFEKRLKEFRYG